MALQCVVVFLPVDDVAGSVVSCRVEVSRAARTQMFFLTKLSCA